MSDSGLESFAFGAARSSDVSIKMGVFGDKANGREVNSIVQRILEESFNLGILEVMLVFDIESEVRAG